MTRVSLGKTDLNIGPLVLGSNVFGWNVDRNQSFEILDAFYEQGFNCIDTADVYSRWIPGNQGGESESIIGEWMKARNNRKDIIIATKVGMEMGPHLKGLSKKYIKQAAEASLQRLQTDYIDLYQSHEEDSETPIEETLQAFDELIKEGKIRYIGASNYSPEGLRTSLKVAQNTNLPDYRTLQPRFNLYDRKDFETNLATICECDDLGVIPYYSLASGFLSGKYRNESDLSQSPRGGGVKAYLNERGMNILSALDKVATAKGVTPTQVSIAWLNHHPRITAALASATNTMQLRELLKGAQLKLTQEEIEVLNKASAY